MTKEELKEAIAATITENGQKGITGQALANLLNEIVDAAGEGGGGVLTLTLPQSEPEVDPETGEPVLVPNEANAQVYRTIIEGMANNITYPLNVIYGSDPESGLAAVICISMYMPEFLEEAVVLLLLASLMGKTVAFYLYEDGSMIQEQ